MKKTLLLIIALFISIFSYSQPVSIPDLISEHPNAIIEKDEDEALVFVTVRAAEEDLDLFRTFIYAIDNHLSPMGIKSYMEIEIYPEMLKELKNDEDLEETEPGVFVWGERNLTYYIYTQEKYCVVLMVVN